MKVQCYGGPLHGKEVSLPDDRRRFDAMMAGPWNVANSKVCRVSPLSRITNIEDQFRKATYTIETYHQVAHGPDGKKVYRYYEVAIIDGANLTRSENNDLLDTMSKIPWDWREPNILTDFEDWFRWNLYNNHIKYLDCKLPMQISGPWFDSENKFR